MAKLNQIIAIEKGVKSQSFSKISQLNKDIQKKDEFNGFVKTYNKKDENGEDLPSEKKRVTQNVDSVLTELERSLTDLLAVTARKDYTNCVAKADVVVDGQTVVAGAPVSYLLFLEKVFTDVRTFINNLPVLDENEVWKMDAESKLYKSEPISTHRTKKIQKAIVLYDATDKHPAQTQLITEDVIAGYWNQVKMSGAISKRSKDGHLEKVDTLLRAIKEAREAANNIDEVSVPSMSKLFDYILEQ